MVGLQIEVDVQLVTRQYFSKELVHGFVHRLNSIRLKNVGMRAPKRLILSIRNLIKAITSIYPYYIILYSKMMGKSGLDSHYVR